MNMFTNNQRGLSLLEIIVSIAILAFLMVALSGSWSGNLLRFRKTKFKHTVTQLLERKAIELENQYSGKPLGEIPKKSSGKFGDDYPKYRWEMETRVFEMPDITNLLLGGGDSQQSQNETSQSIMGQMREYFSKTIKEIRVSVYYKEGKEKKEVQYSVATFLVDYNQPIPIGGLGPAKEIAE